MYHKLHECGIIIIIGVEKNNDDAKKSNNKHDALGNTLRTEARLEALRRGIIGVVPDIKYVTGEYMTTLTLQPYKPVMWKKA